MTNLGPKEIYGHALGTNDFLQFYLKLHVHAICYIFLESEIIASSDFEDVFDLTEKRKYLGTVNQMFCTLKEKNLKVIF